MKVPIADLHAQYLELETEILENIALVMKSGCFIDGENVQRLEEQIANECGAQFGVGVASGTDALVLSLRACRIGAGDEVITTPFTFGATTEAIALLGATPVYVDIDPCTFNLDVNQIEKAITSRTKAILPVDLFGQMVDRDALRDLAARYNLKIIVDAAQAIGAKRNGEKVAECADATTLSFYPTKNLGACGDAGMVLTNNPEIADTLRSLHVHGQSSYGYFEQIGYCSRLDTLQAVILMAKLPHLNKWNEARRKNAALYHCLLNGKSLTLPGCEQGNYHIYHQYTIRHPERDAIQEYLKERGIDSKLFYPMSMHLQKAYAFLGYKEGDFPEAEKAAKEVLSIPIVPELSEVQISYVAEQLCAYTDSRVNSAVPAA